jgi:hypothetical protein
VGVSIRPTPPQLAGSVKGSSEAYAMVGWIRVKKGIIRCDRYGRYGKERENKKKDIIIVSL